MDGISMQKHTKKVEHFITQSNSKICSEWHFRWLRRTKKHWCTPANAPGHIVICFSWDMTCTREYRVLLFLQTHFKPAQYYKQWNTDQPIHRCLRHNDRRLSFSRHSLSADDVSKRLSSQIKVYFATLLAKIKLIWARVGGNWPFSRRFTSLEARLEFGLWKHIRQMRFGKRLVEVSRLFRPFFLTSIYYCTNRTW